MSTTAKHKDLNDLTSASLPAPERKDTHRPTFQAIELPGKLRTAMQDIRDMIKGTFEWTFKVVFVVAVMAMCWRFLTLYEVQVKATSVEAQIMMERHQLWMQDVRAKSGAKSAKEVADDYQKQTAGVPVPGPLKPAPVERP